MDSVVLNSQDIVEVLEKGIDLGKNRHHEAAIRRAIAKVQKEELCASSDSYDVHMIKRVIHVTGRHMFRWIILNDLLSCDIVVLPLDACIAQACVLNNRRLIVLSHGMLDLQHQMVRWRFLAWTIPRALKEIPSDPRTRSLKKAWITLTSLFPDGWKSRPKELFGSSWGNDIKSEFRYLSFILLAMSYRHGLPLPDFRSIQRNNMAVMINSDFTKTIMFILLHELGHLTLGHCANTSDLVDDHKLVLDEHIDKYKAREFAADQFVRSAFRDNAQILAYIGILEASLEFFQLYEMYFGEQGDVHPFTVNRLHHAVMRNSGFALYGSHVPAFMQNEDWWKSGAYAEPAKIVNEAREKRMSGSQDARNSRFSAEARNSVVDRIKAIEPYFEQHGMDLKFAYDGSVNRWPDIAADVLKWAAKDWTGMTRL